MTIKQNFTKLYMKLSGTAKVGEQSQEKNNDMKLFLDHKQPLPGIPSNPSI